MPAKPIKIEPGPNGVGQLVTFDNGATEFDAYNAVKPEDLATAPQPAPEPQPSFWSRMAGAMTPAAAQMAGAPPVASPQPESELAVDRSAEGAQARYDAAHPDEATNPGVTERRAANPAPVLQPGIADQPAPEASAPTLTPGIADRPELQLRVIPGTPGGEHQASRTVQGISAQGQRQIEQATEGYSRAVTEGADEETRARQEFADQIQARALSEYREALARKEAALAEQRKNRIVQQNIQTKLNDAASFKPDRHQLFEGTAGGFRALLSAVGMIAGGMLSGLQGGPNQALEAVFRMIDDNVQDQVAQNTGVYNELVRRLGDEQAAADLLREQHLRAVQDMAGALDLSFKGADIRANIAGLRSRAAQEAARARLAAAEKLAPIEHRNFVNVASTPARVEVVNQTREQLQALGVDPKAYQSFLTEPIGGAGTASGGQMLQQLNSLRRDRDTLRLLAEANGGALPGKDGVIDLDRTDAGRRLRNRLGIDKATKAVEVEQIVGSMRSKLARSYGGAITESDLEAAGKEIGDDMPSIERYLARKESESTQLLGAAASARFGSVAPYVIGVAKPDIASASQALEPIEQGKPR